jgi:3-hydroxyacyl-CoA dehydrogenase (EC 1.1.1.35)
MQQWSWEYNHPIGPIELTDVVGLDVRLGVLEYLREELGERFKPPQLLRQKVRAGKLGKNPARDSTCGKTASRFRRVIGLMSNQADA